MTDTKNLSRTSHGADRMSPLRQSQAAGGQPLLDPWKNYCGSRVHPAAACPDKPRIPAAATAAPLWRRGDDCEAKSFVDGQAETGLRSSLAH
jgi:hypothetical protein